MPTLTATIKASIVADYSNALDLSTPKDSLSWGYSASLATGTAAGQCDLIWHDSRTLATAAESIDLSGALSNGLGVTAVFVRVRVIAIENTQVETGRYLLVGGVANGLATWVGDAATDKVRVGASGVFLLTSPVDGFAVVAGTGDLLRVESVGGSVTYKIIILGTTA